MSIRFIVTSIMVFVLTVVAIADDSNELDYKPGELIVRFAPKAKGINRSKAERKAILATINGGTIKHSFKRVSGLTVVKLPKNTKVKDKINAFKNRSDILYAEPNYKIYLHATFPDDPDLSKLWGLHNTGQEHPLEGGGTDSGTEDADIDAPEAWDIATDADDIVVAVIDTGVDYDHEDLAANMWTNEAELNGTTGVDDDGNGYTDDIYGYDFCTYGGKARDSDPDDDNGHGTHVAGTIGAVGNNNKGVAAQGDHER